MKTTLKITMLLCLVLLYQKGIGQNNLNNSNDSTILSIYDNNNERSIHKFNNYCEELEYKNTVLMMEAEIAKKAYNDLLQKVERLKSEIKQYQKLIREYTLMPSTEFFSCTNVRNSDVLCGESFLEEAIPNSVSENSVITYFVTQRFAHAIISFSNDSGVEVANYIINEYGYGQCVINAGELKTGAYNYCLVVDGRALDCKKMVLMK